MTDDSPCITLSDPTPDRVKSARRHAWKNIYGPIPKGMLVLRICDDPSCINLRHLYLGTHKDSARDMVRRRRHVGNFRHSDELVAQIRAATGKQADIAAKFNVSQGYVSQIRRGKQRPLT